MNKIEISLQDLFESDVSLETVGLKTGISSVLLDEYRRGLKSWRKMPLDVALRLTDYWNSREDVLSKYQRVILMNQLTLIQAFRKMCPDAKCDYYDDSGIESALGVLDSGLEGMYDDVYGLSDSVSESVSGFIIDVLSMYNDVGWRYRNLSEVQRNNLNPSWIVFDGFSRSLSADTMMHATASSIAWTCFRPYLIKRTRRETGICFLKRRWSDTTGAC